MTKKYDLIISGAGPAGLMSAIVAGENGLKTALIERKTDMTKIIRVDGGNLSPVNEYYFGQITTFNPAAKKISFPVCGFSIPYSGPYRDVYGFNVFSPGGARITFGDRDIEKENPDKYRVGISLDKEELLKGMLQEAEKNGADIFPGTNVTGIEKHGETLTVTANSHTFEAPFVIAADGVNSRIARLMGMNRQRTFFATYQDYGWTIEDVDIPEDDECITFVLTGYGTFSMLSTFKEGLFHVGSSSFNPGKHNLVQQLNKFVYEDSVYAPWFKGGRKTGEYACICTQLSPMKEPFKDNVLFIGDAAWLQEISNAVAACCGWKAANAVTLALLNGKPNKEGIAGYQDWWEKYIWGPYGSMEFKPVTMQDFLNADDIDYLAGIITEPLERTLNFYKFFSLLGETYGGLFPRIQEERPDVMEKMMNLVNHMDDIEEAARKAGHANR